MLDRSLMESIMQKLLIVLVSLSGRRLAEALFHFCKEFAVNSLSHSGFTFTNRPKSSSAEE